MSVYYSDDGMAVHHGDAFDVLAEMPDASVDAVVTDPPYGLEFMGKEWDAPWQRGSGVGEHNAGFAPGAPAVPGVRGEVKALPNFTGSTNPTCRNCGGTRNGNDRQSRRRCACDSPEFPNTTLPRMVAYQAWCERWATECLRILKPGGHLLAFGGSRTFHRLTCAVEDSGFDIRDTISWLYGSGFPKSLNVAKAIASGTGRPEDIRRAAMGEGYEPSGRGRVNYDHGGGSVMNGLPGEVELTEDAERWNGWGTALKPGWEPIIVARRPLARTVASNVLEHGTGALNIDGCRIEAAQDYRDKCASVVGLSSNRNGDAYGEWAGVREDSASPAGRWPANVLLDEDAAAEIGTSRYYYTAKASPDERPRVDGIAHPTVKPLELMRWLVRLVTPPGGLVLDPFAGSGTTGEACLIEGFRCVLVEREETYLPLIKARLSKPIQPTLGSST